MCGASPAFSLSRRSEQPAPRLPCLQPGSPFSTSVGTRPSPPPSPPTRGGGWSQPSCCPLFAGVCLLLPEPAGSEGAGELRGPGSAGLGSGQAVGGAAGRRVEAPSDRARTVARGPGGGREGWSGCLAHLHPFVVLSSSGLPSPPRRGVPWGPEGTFFPRRGGGRSHPHPTPEGSRSGGRSRQGYS